MLKYLVGLLIVCGVSGGLAVPSFAQPPTIAGAYTCEGSNQDGTTYTGEVDITAQGDVWALQWTFQQGSGIGVGLLNAEGTILSVVFQTSSGAIGLASYRVERRGTAISLVGQWTVPGDPEGRVLTETLTPRSIRAAR